MARMKLSRNGAFDVSVWILAFGNIIAIFSGYFWGQPAVYPSNPGYPAYHLHPWFPGPLFFIFYLPGVAMMYLGIAGIMRINQKANREILFRLLLPTMLLWPILGYLLGIEIEGGPFGSLIEGWPYYLSGAFYLLMPLQWILYYITIFFTLWEYRVLKNKQVQHLSNSVIGRNPQSRL